MRRLARLLVAPVLAALASCGAPAAVPTNPIEVPRVPDPAAQAPAPRPPLEGRARVSFVDDQTDIETELAFGPDGATIAAESPWHHLDLWDVGSGRVRLSIETPGDLLQIAWSPDGKTVAAAMDRAVGVWDAATGAPRLLAATELASSSRSVRLSPDASRFATLSPSGALRVRDGGTGDLLSAAQTEARSRIDRWSSGSDVVVTRTPKGEIDLWDARTGTRLGPPAKLRAAGLVIGPDGRTALKLGDRALEFVDALDGKVIATHRAPTRDEFAREDVSWSPDGGTCAVVWQRARGPVSASGRAFDITVFAALYDARTGKLLGQLPRGASDDRRVVIWSPDGATVYDRDGGGFGARTGKPSGTRIAKQSAGGSHDVTLSADGRLALSQDYERLPFAVRDAASGRVVLRIPEIPRRWDPPRAAAFAVHGLDVAMVALAARGSGPEVGSLGMPSRLVVWHPRSDEVDASPARTDGLSDLVLSPDGAAIATFGPLPRGNDGSALLWSARAAEQGTLETVRRGRGAVVFSPDGARAATVTGKAVRLWDARTGAAGRTLDTPGSEVVWSPDGAVLASIAEGVTTWDTQTGAKLAAIAGTSAAFRADGRLLAWSRGPTIDDPWEVRAGKAPLGPPSAPPPTAIRVVDARTGALVETLAFPAGKDPGGLVAWAPGASALVAGLRNAGDRPFVVWDVAAGKRRAVLQGSSTSVGEVVWSRDGALIAGLVVPDQTALVWDAGTGRIARQIRMSRLGTAASLAFTDDGRMLALRGAHEVRLVRLADGASITLRADADGDRFARVTYLDSGHFEGDAAAIGRLRIWTPSSLEDGSRGGAPGLFAGGSTFDRFRRRGIAIDFFGP
jgi:WD40 repeat protein